MARRIFQEPPLRRPHSEAHDEDRRNNGERVHRPLVQSRDDRGEIARRDGGGGYLDRYRSGGTAAPRDARDDERDEHAQLDDGESPQPEHRTLHLRAPQERDGGDRTDDAIGAEEVAEVQQRGMRAAEHEQPGVASQQKRPHLRGGGAGGVLSAGELHQAVAEHDGEDRIRARMDEHGQQQRSPRARPIGAMRFAPGWPGGEVGRVDQRDEQQHGTTCQVGGELALGGAHRASRSGRRPATVVGRHQFRRNVYDRSQLVYQIHYCV